MAAIILIDFIRKCSGCPLYKIERGEFPSQLHLLHLVPEYFSLYLLDCRPRLNHLLSWRIYLQWTVLHCYQVELLAHCPRQFLVSGYPYQRIAKVVAILFALLVQPVFLVQDHLDGLETYHRLQNRHLGNLPLVVPRLHPHLAIQISAKGTSLLVLTLLPLTALSYTLDNLLSWCQ